MLFDPLDFLTKLAALVPPPRVHLVRYSGVFAPNAKLRAQVVPKGLTPNAKHISNGSGVDQESATGSSLSWPELMKRVFDIDVLECPKCQTKGMQQIAAITAGESLRRLLRSVGLPADSPGPHPPRLPQQPEFDFAA